MKTDFNPSVVQRFIESLTPEQRTALQDHPGDLALIQMPGFDHLTILADETVTGISGAYAGVLVADAWRLLHGDGKGA